MISFEVFLPVVVIVMIKLGKKIPVYIVESRWINACFIPIIIVEFWAEIKTYSFLIYIKVFGNL